MPRATCAWRRGATYPYVPEDNPELSQKLEKQLRAMFEEERKKAAAEQEAKRKASKRVCRC
jgi:hypothetical protein